MAAFLYRLGLTAFERRRYVVLLWLVALIALGVGAFQAPGGSDESFSMPGIESQKAYNLMEQRFPGAAADGASAQVVFVAPTGESVLAPENRKTIEDMVMSLSSGSQVADVADPFNSAAVSADETTAFTSVVYEVIAADLTEQTKSELAQAADQARAKGLVVETGGSALDGDDGPGGTAEMIGISVAAVVLLITFGSMAAAGMPLLTAIIGVAVSLFGILLLSSPLGLSSDTLTLALMLGLAVGIDYALFVVSRYREERASGVDPREAAGKAVGTAGSAVVFAGLTVVIALAGLSLIGIPTLTKMGLAAAGAVATAVLVALTIVPALLGFWPNAVLARRSRKSLSIKPSAASANIRDNVAPTARAQGNLGARWARFVLRRPLLVLLVAIAGLVALAVPMAFLQLGMPGDEAKPTSTSERRAYDALADGFGPGFNGPLTIVVDGQGAADPTDAVQTIRDAITGTVGVVTVSSATFNEAGDTAIFSVTPSTSPTDEETEVLVESIRDKRPPLEESTSATFEVTGTTALNIDIAAKVQSALMPYLLVVVGLAVVLLMLVFRSVLVPIKAALGFLLSVLAALGVVVLVFQKGYFADLFGVEQSGPIMTLMPIFMVGIVFGLAMDYEVFLVYRIREAYTRGEDAHQSIVTGFQHSARVVVAAALIMIAVFSGFVGEAGAMIKMIGFGLAVAVLFDAFVVRMAIVPAVLTLLGDKAWWLPTWLDRMLPRIDVEGARLEYERADAPPETKV